MRCCICASDCRVRTTNSRKDEAFRMRMKWVLIAPLALMAMLLFAFIGGQIVLRLWNWLLPPLFGWPLITFWPPLGLLVLCPILFAGLRPRAPARSTFAPPIPPPYHPLTPH